jgi:Protein kinase C terminal domain.
MSPASVLTWYVLLPDFSNSATNNVSQLDARDTDNFDREFTSEAPQDSYVDGPALSQTMQQQFAGWSYNRPVAGLGDAGGSVKDPSFGSIPE